jgi:hypothetical protein
VFPSGRTATLGSVLAYVLDGWELLLAIIALFAFILVLALVVLTRETRSKKMRFGIFVEREYEDGSRDDSEWPTQH